MNLEDGFAFQENDYELKLRLPVTERLMKKAKLREMVKAIGRDLGLLKIETLAESERLRLKEK